MYLLWSMHKSGWLYRFFLCVERPGVHQQHMEKALLEFIMYFKCRSVLWSYLFSASTAPVMIYKLPALSFFFLLILGGEAAFSDSRYQMPDMTTAVTASFTNTSTKPLRQSNLWNPLLGKSEHFMPKLFVAGMFMVRFVSIDQVCRKTPENVKHLGNVKLESPMQL